MNDKDKPQFDAAAQEELKGVPEEFLDDGRQRNVNQLLVKKMRKGDDWQEVLERVIFERLGVDPELQQARYPAG